MTSETPVQDDAAEESKPKLTLDVKVETPNACQRHVTVTVSREDIDRYMDEAFSDLVPKAEVPGFRAGRAPRKLVESRFREQVADQVKGSLLMDSMTQVSEDQEFSAISEPDLDIDAVEIPPEGSMTFEFDLEVRPDFDVPVWQGLTLEKPVREYNDEDIEHHLANLLARYAQLAPFDGAAEDDDHVVANLTFRHDGEVLSEAQEQTIRIRPKLSFQDGTLEKFSDLMCGAKAGDKREGKIKLTSAAAKEALQGKEADVEFDVLEVKRMDLPKLNTAFLEKLGGFASKDELKAAVREELERQLSYHQHRRIRQQIMAMLTESAKWDLPPELLKRQSSRELERAVMELQASGFNDEDIRAHSNQIRQNNLYNTERSLKEHFILERIAEDQKVNATDADYQREIGLIAMQRHESPRRVRARMEKRGQMDSLRNQIIERKVINLIMSHAVFNETKFEPEATETAAVEHAICGEAEERIIPEAKHGGDAEELRKPADRS